MPWRESSPETDAGALEEEFPSAIGRTSILHAGELIVRLGELFSDNHNSEACSLKARPMSDCSFVKEPILHDDWDAITAGPENRHIFQRIAIQHQHIRDCPFANAAEPSLLS
jgi:hypothetical protein